MQDHKVGVLLVNLGTPDSPSRYDVYKYLREFLTDKRVIDYPFLARQVLVQGIIAPFRSGPSAKLYQKLWREEGSPLKIYGEKLVKKVQLKLGSNFEVRLAMRYQNPSIKKVLNGLLSENIQELIVVPMFAQYASATSGSVLEEVMKNLMKRETIPALKMINSYADFEPMLDIFADNAKAFDLSSYDHVLFSFHGLPERQLFKADPGCHCKNNVVCCEVWQKSNFHCYSAQCRLTARGIAQRLSLKENDFTVCFQSRLGPEKWSQPYASQIIKDLGHNGAKRILVFSPAFLADCLETVIEIGTEYQELFEEHGGEKIDLVPSLNANEAWAGAMAELVLNHSQYKVLST